MAVNALLVNLKTDAYSVADVVKAVKADKKVLDALTEELAAKVALTAKGDSVAVKNALETFGAVR